MPGPTSMTQNLKKPEDFFRYILDESIIEFVASNSGLRLAREFGDIRREHDNTGRDVLTVEVYSYCGTLILLGFLKMLASFSSWWWR